MSERGKKIFLAICIITPFLLYTVYYYSIMVKNAPYRFSDFVSISFKYGYGDSLINQYDSKTGDFQYVNKDDSLIKTKVKMRKDDLLYLHRKAAELGFWNFPDELKGDIKTSEGRKSLTYYIEFNYKDKSKRVLYEISYEKEPKLADAAKSLITEISKMISDVRDRNED